MLIAARNGLVMQRVSTRKDKMDQPKHQYAPIAELIPHSISGINFLTDGQVIKELQCNRRNCHNSAE